MRALLALLLFTAVAAADESRVQAIAPRRPTCTPNGGVWFEVQHRDTARDAVQTTLKLYGNGAVSITRTRGTSSTKEAGRCLSAGEMENVEAILKQAPWKTVAIKRKVACKTTATTSKVISVFGKAVFTDRECKLRALDRTSEAAVKQLEAQIGSGATRGDCYENPLAKGCF